MRAEERPFPQAFNVVAGRSGQEIEFARYRFPLAAVRSIEREEVAERDTNGLVVALVGFAIFATLLLLLVTEFGWRSRFLVGTGFLALLAAAGLGELLGLNRLRYVRYTVTLDDGSRAEFVTADAAMAIGFEAAITGQRGPTGFGPMPAAPAAKFN